jgi:DNA-directed RNA polymerase subunit beta'
MTNMIANSSDSLVSKDVISLFGRQEKGIRSINGMSIKLAGPDDILSWSYGEVKNGETISYRTYKPEKDGLLCAKIFGPTRDYECQCGKYRRIKYKGITCEKCGVEVTVSKVRRERLGHIDLACPVVHILFLRGTNSIISTTLGMTLKDVERVLYYDAYAVVDSGNTTMNKKQVLSDEQYEEALNEFGDSFEAMAGADCIMRLLADIDLEKEIDFLHNQIAVIKSDIKRRSLLKRVRVLSDFLKS